MTNISEQHAVNRKPIDNHKLTEMKYDLKAEVDLRATNARAVIASNISTLFLAILA